MADILDTPIQREVPIEDTPIERVKVEPNNKALKDLFTAQAAYIDSYVTGRPPAESVKAFETTEQAKANLNQSSIDKSRTDSEAITEEFVNNPNMGTGTVQTNLLATSEARKQAMLDASNPDKQFIESITNSPEGFLNEKKSVARMQLQRLLMEAEAEVSGLDVAAGFGSAIIPFVDTGKRTAATGTVFGQQDVMQTMIVNYKNLSDEDQLTMFPAIKEHLIDNLGEWDGVTQLRKFLTPGGEEDLAEFSNWWKALDVLDIIGIGGMAKTFIKSRTLTKTLKEAGSVDEAVDINMGAIADPDFAKSVNTTPETAVSDTLPFDTSIADIASTDSLSVSSMKVLKNTFEEIDDTTSSIIEGRDLLLEGILNTKERAGKEAETYKLFQEAGHENIQVVGKTQNSTTFSYQARDVDGKMFDETFELDLELSDVQTWQQSVISIVSEFIASPTVFAKNLTKLDVSAAQRVDYVNAKINNQLNKAMLAAIKPIGSPFKPGTKAKLAKVDDVLRQGDEFANVDGTRGKVFTPDELINQHNLAEDEIVAYYNVNRLYNNLYRIANHNKREEMIAKGYKQVEIEGLERTFGKPQASAESAIKSIKEADGNFVYDPEAGVMINAKNSDAIRSYYEDQGKVLTRLDTPLETGLSEGKAIFVITNRDNVSNLGQKILHKKVGYVPRTYDNAAHFVKEMVDSSVDGKVLSNPKTLRFFNNEGDANTYRQTLVDESVSRGEDLSIAEARFKSVPDRESETFGTAIGDVSQGSGGLYTAARAEDAILYGLDGTQGARVNAFEALTRNIATVSKATSINQWRLGLEQRWINSVNEYLTSIGSPSKVDSFGGLPDTVKGSKAGAFFSKMEETVRDWQGFPSREEQLWSGFVQRMVDWSASKGLRATGEVIGSVKSKDPIAAARGAAFHSLLGWFNPAQLWVQAQGASVALSLAAGKYATKVVRNTSALTAIGEGTVEQSARFKFAAGVSAVDADELQAIHGLWMKTGLGDSVLQTADHAAASKGYGITQAALSTAADKGLFFYRGGELFSRRTAFTTAIERYKDTNNLTSIKGIGDDALKSIFDDTNNMLLNMTKANRAKWQKGILSLPTQFLQVTYKSLETVTGANKNFTGPEVGRILAGQLALYGAAGVPLVALPTMYAIETLGITQDDIDNNPKAARAWNDGFWGVTSHWLLGADVEVASRGSLVRGATEFVDRWFLTEASVQERMLGAFGATGTRAWDTFAKQIKPISLGVHELAPIDVVKIPTMSILSTFSSFRNGEKAFIMESMGEIWDKNSRTVVEKDFDFMTIIGQAIGFSASEGVRAWDIEERRRHHLDVKKKITDLTLQKLNSYALRANTIGISEEFNKQFNEEMSLLGKVMQDPMDNLDIAKSVRKAVVGDTKLEMAISKYERATTNALVDEVSLMKAGLLGNKILTLNPPLKEEE